LQCRRPRARAHTHAPAGAPRTPHQLGLEHNNKHKQTNTTKHTNNQLNKKHKKVDLPKPLGLKFARGADGGAYVVTNDPALGNTDARIQPGDKIVQISASFGSDVWDAQNFGQIMYAIRTRSGTVYLKIKRNFGDMSGLTVRVLLWLLFVVVVVVVVVARGRGGVCVV
jgi:C-terminal processing protease CtpA/Prc